VVLGSCLFMATSTIFIKRLTDTEPPDAIVAYMLLMLMPVMLFASLFVWVWPTWEQLGWLLVMGMAATLAHMGLTRAFRAADVSVVLPFDFSRLIFVAIFAWFIFGEATSIYTWAGAVVISIAAVYIAHRERIAEKERRRTARAAAAREPV
jgi:drug/metabolite transporter (DMT)-like permease